MHILSDFRMEAPDIFENISPLDHRYYLANKDLFDKLRSSLSEAASVRYCLLAEASLLRAHIQLNLNNDDNLLAEADDLVNRVSPSEVAEEEARIKHNIRSLVNVIKRHISKKLSPYVHLGATSVDILDTSFAMRIRDSVRQVILPVLVDLEEQLIRLTESHSETPQVGRTHGQYAVPITLGFAFAQYIARLGKSIKLIDNLSQNLRGKLAGAVGAYNATSMITADPEELERLYCGHLGLKVSEISTQMVEPEYLLRLLLEINISFGIIANLADDLRNLQRSEIAEVHELFETQQVGSSTMPQKRNPENSEHVKSLWKAFAPRVITFFMDQISEHQRDLTNSASSRFVVEYLSGFCAAAHRMVKILKNLHVSLENLHRNLELAGDSVLAEPAYILLALEGETDAHELVRRATLSRDKNGTTIIDELKATGDWEKMARRFSKVTGKDAGTLFTNPYLYRGKAKEKAEQIAKKYRSLMVEVRGGLLCKSKNP